MRNIYQNPLCNRYSSAEMQRIFSDDNKYGLWRRLWIALAESERELGLNITEAQIAQMKANIYPIDYDRVAAIEKETNHDVMAHIHAYGEQCPDAEPIIHLGATSCYVTDNADLLMMYDALKLVREELRSLMNTLARRALEYKDMPTLAFTHFQPAQLTTVGKRLALYLQDLLLDYEEVESLLQNFRLRGAKGTTGTWASYKELFDGDIQKVYRLNDLIAAKFGMKQCFDLSGQTYTRKFDYRVLAVLSGIAQSATKFATDLRLLQSRREAEEPFGKKQVGSSAMAYKRNPILSERICSLARFVVTLPANAAMTECGQWFERTLDDSANRRIVLPEAFLAADAVLLLYNKIAAGMTFYPKVIARHVAEELPFMATEKIIMVGVKNGGDRQTLHECIRKHSMDTAAHIKIDGGGNDLLARLKTDPYIERYVGNVDDALRVEDYVGFSAEQTETFVKERILPILG